MISLAVRGGFKNKLATKEPKRAFVMMVVLLGILQNAERAKCLKSILAIRLIFYWEKPLQIIFNQRRQKLHFRHKSGA